MYTLVHFFFKKKREVLILLGFPSLAEKEGFEYLFQYIIYQLITIEFLLG